MRKFLSLVLALVMTMSLVTISAGAKEFTDDDKLNYDEAVAVISEIGVVDGYANGSFNPQGGLTRQAAAKIICNLILGPTTAAELSADTAPYPDVPVTNEFAGYIAYCAKEGIISGYADGTFKGGNPLTGYAFAKMLLGALGYDAATEGYTGANWSINVAKQFIGIGLNAGLKDEFNGVDHVTREEAALYAFNTLQATMVEYTEKTTVNVGGAEVVLQGTARDVEWGTATLNDGKIEKDGFVQFAEKYFSKLAKADDTDEFMRPAHTWTYNKKEVGTYVDYTKLVESYTTGVKGKTVYELLGAVAIRDNDVESYINGADGTVAKDQLVRNYNSNINGSADGVLTEVYLDADKELITVVSVETWLAQATADYSTSKEYAPLSVYKASTPTTYNVDVIDVANVVDVVEDGWYLVNISYKDNAKGDVVIIDEAQVLTDSTVTKFSADNNDKNDTKTDGQVTSLTTGGEKYNDSKWAIYDDDVLGKYDDGRLTDITYNVYLDNYGYFIGVDVYSGTANYVFITGYDLNSSNLSVTTATAAGIFLDGTMETMTVNVKDTNKNIEKADHRLFDKWEPGDANNGAFDCNRWYTYTKTDAGVYTLKPATRMTLTQMNTGDIIDTANLDVVGEWVVTERVYGEDETVFLTVEEDVVDTTNGNTYAIADVTGVYTGVQSVDLEIVAAKYPIGAEVYTVYDSEYFVIGAIVLGEAKGSVSNYAYILSDAKSEEKIGDTYYWEFDVVMGGEVQTLTAKSKYASTIDALDKNTVQELRFDGDYVVTIKDIDDADIYDSNANGDNELGKQVNVKGYEVYDVDAADQLTLSGRTLYVTAGRTDVGLALVSDAKAVTIQDENYSSNVKTEFDSVAGAIGHLAEAEEYQDVEGVQFSGRIVAVLNSKGAAEWVIFINNNDLVTGSSKPVTTNGKYVAEVKALKGEVNVTWSDKAYDEDACIEAAVAALEEAGYAFVSLDTDVQPYVIHTVRKDVSSDKDFPFTINATAKK